VPFDVRRAWRLDGRGAARSEQREHKSSRMRVAVARDDEHFASVAWHRTANSARHNVAGLPPLNVTGFRVTMPGKRGNNAGKRQETKRRIPGVFTFIPCSPLVRRVTKRPSRQFRVYTVCVCVCVCVCEREKDPLFLSVSLYPREKLSVAEASKQRANSTC